MKTWIKSYLKSVLARRLFCGRKLYRLLGIVVRFLDKNHLLKSLFGYGSKRNLFKQIRVK